MSAGQVRGKLVVIGIGTVAERVAEICRTACSAERCLSNTCDHVKIVSAETVESLYAALWGDVKGHLDETVSILTLTGAAGIVLTDVWHTAGSGSQMFTRVHVDGLHVAIMLRDQLTLTLPVCLFISDIDAIYDDCRALLKFSVHPSTSKEAEINFRTSIRERGMLTIADNWASLSAFARSSLSSGCVS